MLDNSFHVSDVCMHGRVLDCTFFLIFPPGRRLTSSCLGSELPPAAQVRKRGLKNAS